jgi:hypothetical protein
MDHEYVPITLIRGASFAFAASIANIITTVWARTKYTK